MDIAVRTVVDVFFFNDTATTEIYTLSLHGALPIFPLHPPRGRRRGPRPGPARRGRRRARARLGVRAGPRLRRRADRKSTRLNSSHANISYAVFCLKKNHSHHILYYFSCATSHIKPP